VVKAILISAVPPLIMQTDANPDGLPKSVFELDWVLSTGLSRACLSAA
jgi:hypothetical protein